MSFRAREGNSYHQHVLAKSILTYDRLLASDDEFSLFSLVIFRKVHDEFIQKCRESKYIVRDFVYSEEEVERQRDELENAAVTEKELWVSSTHPSLSGFNITMLGGTFTPFTSQFLRVVPNFCSSQGYAPSHRECTTLRSPGPIQRHCCQGTTIHTSDIPFTFGF